MSAKGRKTVKKNLDEGLPLFSASSQLSAPLLSHYDLDQILDQTVRQIKEIFGAKSCGIFLLNFTDILEFKKGFGLSKRFQKAFDSQISPKLTYEILNRIYPKISNDTLGDYKTFKSLCDLLRRENIHKEIGIPLKVENKSIGILNVGRDSSYPDFSKKDLRLLNMLGNHIALTVSNAELYKQFINNSEVYGNLIEGTLDSIVTVDLKGNIIYCNKATEILTGYAKKELIGKHFSQVGWIKNKNISHYLKLFKELLRGKKLAPFRMEVRRKDGKPYWFEVHVSGIKVKDKVTGFQIDTRDITERMKIETALIRKENIATQRARLLNDLRRLDRIDDILTRVCKTIRDSELFERAVMTLHKPGGRICHLGQVGLPPNVVKRARQAPPIDDELRSRITHKKFRISDSFFIPTEASLNYTKTGRYIPQKKKYQGRGDWQPGDELFLPLRDFSGEIMGYLSVDTPTYGCRPDIETIRALEILVEAAAARVREVEALQALKRESEFSHSILETANSLILCLDADARITAFNQECERVTGYRREEVLGKRWPDLFLPPDQRHTRLKSFADWVRAHPSDRYEGSIVTKSGETRTILWSNTSIFGADKRDVVAIAIGHDITDRKKTEKRIEVERNKLRDILDGMVDGVGVVDANGNFQQINRAYVKMLGYQSPEELIGKPLFKIIAIKELTRIRKHFIEVIKKKERVIKNLEVNLRRKDGREFPTLINIRQRWNEKGNLINSIAIIRDMTERKRSEEALKQSEKKYRELADSLPQIVFETDKKGDLTFVNRNAFNHYGYTEKDFKKGLNVLQTITPEDRDRAKKNFRRRLRGEKAGGNEYTALRKDGSTFPIVIHSIPIIHENKVMGLRGIIVDLTEHKRAEEALRASENKYRMLLQNLPQKIFLKDNNSVYLSCNESYARDLKIKSDEIAGKTDYDFFPRELAEKYRADDKRIMKLGKTEDIEERYIQQGQEMFVHTVKTAVKDEQGNLIGLLGIFWDVTEHKRAEEAMRDNERRYRSLFEDSPISLWEEDFSDVKAFIDGLGDKGVKDFRKYFEDHPKIVAKCATMVKIIDINNASLDLFKVRSKEELQSSLSNTFSEESYNAFREELVAIAQGKNTFETETITQTLKGDKKHVFVRWSVAPGYEKTLSKVLVSISDITELKRAREQNLLLETSRAMSRTLKLDQVLKIGTEKMAEALKADRCAVAFTDQNIHSLAVKHLYLKNGSPSSIRLRYKISTSKFSEVQEFLKTKGYYQIFNTRTDPLPEAARKYLLQAGIKSSLIIPMSIGKRFLGLFNIGSVKELRNFTEEEIKLAQTIANQVAVAVENSLLIKDIKRKHDQIAKQTKTLERQYQEQGILMKISRALSRTLDLNQILQIATKEAVEALQVDRCGIGLAFPEEGYVEARSIYLKDGRSVSHLLGHKMYPQDLPQTKEMFENRKSIHIPNVYHLSDNSFAKKYFIAEGMKSAILSPMVHGKKLVGFFVLSTMKDFRTFTRDEIRLAQAIANQVAVAIENARLLELVRRNSEDLKALSAKLMNVQEDERKKIAQELHDEIGQTLFAMKMNLDVTKKNLPTKIENLEEIENRLVDTENLLSETIDRIRNLTTNLRPSMLDDFGLIPALKWYIDNFSKRTNIKVNLKTKGFNLRLSSEVETTLYRILQEALTNVAKHAQANEVSILLSQENSFFSLSVQDNGIGFDAKKMTFAKDRLGLFSIKERVELLNGEFEIRSRANRGTKLSVKIPLVEKRV